ncbi:glucose 1-dehydrogenase [Phytohabitans rumicis]|uniref:Threonine dehydrogenase n=1 Tax=Phytohabitans rumicis TaxID=1076125 RepID=A0A6V8L162_9ACTN|nr:glucose 1-dehydrogenase [Phytohabitans rumicis]GFJ89864.1 threonine dehydrogenase [Phytohabitans rumicis]
MRALTITPGRPDSLRLVDGVPEPPEAEGPILVEAIAVGVCGTDREIIKGEYGEAPPDSERLVIGHESLGRVLEDPTGTLRPGDLVAGIVRHPDPVPCPNCAVGEWDMCRNGLYTERGIKGRHGFARERWRVEPRFAVRLDPELSEVGVLVEPTAVVSKAWEHIEKVGTRARWEPRTALITGAGPIGLLAAMLAARRGLDVHVLDRAVDGPKPDLAARLGASYHTGTVADLDFEPDVVVECTGAPSVVVQAIEKVGPDGVVCLTGLSTAGKQVGVDAGALTRAVVLENNVVFGSVNANRRHWDAAAAALRDADRGWLSGLITRRVPIEEYAEAYAPRDGDIKVILGF